MAVNPHFSLPFRFDTLRSGEQVIPVTEQDTLDEIGDCVELILRTVEGERRTLPTFGRPGIFPFMTDRQLAISMVQQAVDESEPRVKHLLRSDRIDERDPGLHRIIEMYELEEGG